MAVNKKDRIKIYVVAVLAVALVVNGYFRIFRSKKGAATASTPVPTQQTPAVVEVPGINIGPPKTDAVKKSFQPALNADLLAAARNIFAPMVVPQKAQPPAPPPETEKEKPVPQFKLKGTIVGGKNPIAIIDDEFVRQGDWIGDFQVVMIGKKTVELDSGDKAITLEILKNE